jgi:hypothetical protein
MSALDRCNRKEYTTDDQNGQPLVLPRGVVYRGRRLKRADAKYKRMTDYSAEVKGPMYGGLEAEIQETLNPERDVT